MTLKPVVQLAFKASNAIEKSKSAEETV